MARKKGETYGMSWRMKQFVKNPWASRLRTRRICLEEKLTEDFMRKYASFLDWYALSQTQEMSEEFIEEMKERVQWKSILDRNLISEKWLRTHADEIRWSALSSSRMTLSIDFLREFKDYIIWNDFTYYRRDIDQQILKEFANNICWIGLVNKSKMDEKLIRQHLLELRGSYSFWSDVASQQKLSEQFIEDYKDHINWRIVSSAQTLSEQFIDKYKDEVDWRYIVSKQKLSQKFIEEHIKDFPADFGCRWWNDIVRYQKVGKTFMRRYRDKIRWYDIKTNLLEHMKLESKVDLDFVNKMIEDYEKKVSKRKVNNNNYYW